MENHLKTTSTKNSVDGNGALAQQTVSCSVQPHQQSSARENAKSDPQLSMKDILDSLPFYVMLIDERHHILQANRAVTTQLGMNGKDIIGKYCPKVMHGLDGPIELCPLEEAVKGRGLTEREILDPGSGRWIRSAVYPTGRTTRDGLRIFLHMISDISDRKRAEEQLTASQHELRELSRHLESVREEEKTKLAREIHDELGQVLTALKMDTAWIAARLPAELESFAEKAKAMNHVVDQAIYTVKRISTELRPGVLDYLGLSAAIRWQTQELESHTPIRASFESSPEEIAMEQNLSTTVFRICQEALTNVVRHSGATRVKVTLRKEPSRIVLSVSDNGEGIKEDQLSDPKSFGLVGMRERALSHGGTVKITGIPGRGTTVSVSIPTPK